MQGIFGQVVDGVVHWLLYKKEESDRYQDRVNKMGDDDMNLVIVGAGDVVQKRLLPAIVADRNKTRDSKNESRLIQLGDVSTGNNSGIRIYVYDKKPVGDIMSYKVEPVQEMFQKDWDKKHTIGWIATPSDTHLSYLVDMLWMMDYVVIEKPLVGSLKEMEAIHKILLSDDRNRIFCLSYYVLEKALSLVFLRRKYGFYRRYLKIAGGKEDIRLSSLGYLKTVQIGMIEDSDKRELPVTGNLLDSMIHPCLIASAFAGKPKGWTAVTVQQNKVLVNNVLVETIRLEATGKMGTKINFLVQKGFTEENPKKKQFAVLNFEKGMILSDFDKKRTKIVRDGGRITEISTREPFTKPYSIQYDLVKKWVQGVVESRMVDGLYHQMEVLEFLFGLL